MATLACGAEVGAAPTPQCVHGKNELEGPANSRAVSETIPAPPGRPSVEAVTPALVVPPRNESLPTGGAQPGTPPVPPPDQKSAPVPKVQEKPLEKLPEKPVATPAESLPQTPPLPLLLNPVNATEHLERSEEMSRLESRLHPLQGLQ